MKQILTISQTHWREMLEHVDKHVPREACGLLAGKNDRVEKVMPVRNQTQSPVRFVMDPYEQLQAFDWIESHGLELLGIFHSHPAGPATASMTDIAEAAYDVVHIIWSRSQGHWQARGFWIEEGAATEVTLQIVS
ncbi:MAG TPA: M67 family metallopeptidase [Anaerolineales bacterium]|jgi:proteasome lid subunit RPN8/RPN11|nr:M67 family metallopeptidase [Anaerolineales bacterium]